MSRIVRQHPAFVNDFRVIIYDDHELYLKNLTKLRGKRIVIGLEKESKRRSLPQNKYYHGVVVKILADEFGYTKEECHDILKRDFLRIPGENGKPDKIGSTRDLDTIGFEEYLEKIRFWAIIEYNITIPLPNEVAIFGDVFI